MKRRWIALSALIVIGLFGTGATDAARVKIRVGPKIVVSKPRPLRTAVIVAGQPRGVIDVNVKPKATAVYVDGKLRGTAGQLDGRPGKLVLRPGVRRIKLVTPGGVVVRRDVWVRAGVEINLGLDLRG